MPMNFELPKVAFKPFFDTPVAFVATRTDGVHRGTVACCIFDEGYAEVIDETTGTSSRVVEITLEVHSLAWSAAISTPPQVGDRFKSPMTGREFRVREVSPTVGSSWAITAREAKT